MERIKRYFPEIEEKQLSVFEEMKDVYAFWNSNINLISRKDFDEFYMHHVLHSLAISKYIQFPKGARLVDVGTGGGFPGVPLAILFPEIEVFLMDSIGKKMHATEEICETLKIENTHIIHSRSEDHKEKYHYITARAVTNLSDFVKQTRHLIKKDTNFNNQGTYYLKGGDLTEETSGFKKAKIYTLSDIFSEEFFETKKLVYLSA
jgi:16S rRNA (guanine527-N7)-methyltransferase